MTPTGWLGHFVRGAYATPPTKSFEGVRGKSFHPRYFSSLFLLHRYRIGPGVDDFGCAVVVVFDEVVEGGDGAGEAVGVGGGAGGGGVEGGGEGVLDVFGEVAADGYGAVAGDVDAGLGEGFLEGHVVVEDEAEDLQDGWHDLAAARRADGDAVGGVFGDDGAHVGERAPAWSYRVGAAWTGVEPHDAVVHEDA